MTIVNNEEAKNFIDQFLNNVIYDDVQEEIKKLESENEKINEMLTSLSDDLLCSTLLLVKKKNCTRIKTLDDMLLNSKVLS